MAVTVSRNPQDGLVSLVANLHRVAHAYCSSLLTGIAVGGSARTCSSTGSCQPDYQCLADLPIGVLLKIMSYLEVQTLCRLSQSSSSMNTIASDSVLWRRLLERDIQQWSVVGHLSHPLIYHETTSNLSPKTLYKLCYVHRKSIPTRQSFSYPIASRLRSFMRRLQGHVAKVLLFGSGLESLPFVRKLFWEEDSPYTPIGLYPGKDGVGSGVCIQHGSTPLNLVTLYTATKAERLAQSAATNQPKINKLISPYSDSSGPELTLAVQELCQQANAFILVVNASNLDSANRDVDISLLNAMLQSSHVPHSPLLVIAASMPSEEAATIHTPPPVQVANWLNLIHIQHPWQVRSVSLDTFAGIHGGLNWLLQTAQI